MKVEGYYTMGGARPRVYATLCDPAALRHCLPGCEKFDPLGEGRYETQLRTGVAGVKGSFTGTVTLSNERPPESYTLALEGKFSGGFVKGTGHITLTEEGEGTRVAYSGDVQIGGPLAAIGQRLMAPAVKSVANAFFKCMDGQVPAHTAQQATSS